MGPGSTRSALSRISKPLGPRMSPLRQLSSAPAITSSSAAKKLSHDAVSNRCTEPRAGPSPSNPSPSSRTTNDDCSRTRRSSTHSSPHQPKSSEARSSRLNVDTSPLTSNTTLRTSEIGQILANDDQPIMHIMSVRNEGIGIPRLGTEQIPRRRLLLAEGGVLLFPVVPAHRREAGGLTEVLRISRNRNRRPSQSSPGGVRGLCVGRKMAARAGGAIQVTPVIGPGSSPAALGCLQVRATTPWACRVPRRRARYHLSSSPSPTRPAPRCIGKCDASQEHEESGEGQ